MTASLSLPRRREESLKQPGASDRPRILVVNDDDDSLFLLDRSVRRALPEADVVLMHSAVAALRYFEEHRVAAVVTDNRMPEMDGLTLVRRIREYDATVPILMVTGSLEVPAAAIEAGASACVSRLCWNSVGTELRNLLPVQWK